MNIRSNSPAATDAAARLKGFSVAASATENAAASLQRVGVLVEIPRLLREMKIDPAPLLAGVGIDSAALSDIEGRLSFPDILALLSKCAEATGRRDFPLLVGAEARLSHLGVIGKLLSAAPNFGTALEDFVANHPRYVRGATTYLVNLRDDDILIGHRVHQASLRGSAGFSVGAAAFGRQIFAELCGVEPTRVFLSVPPPVSDASYARVFGKAEIVFEATHIGLTYPRAALAKPIPTANPATHAQIRKFAAERWNFLQPDVLDRVMRVLVPLVLGGAASQKKTAGLLLLHPRTLNRMLQARGTSFREVRNEARFEIAAQLLLETKLGIADVAQMLGYSELSAFTRFFAGATGLPPSEWRKRALAPRPPQEIA
jgi:AraC-like DNA-binding protein